MNDSINRAQAAVNLAKHDGLPVSGYKPQTQQAVDLVNENKYLEELVLRQIDKLRQSYGVDPRWLAIGQTQLEQAFMAINRSVFKPERVKI